MVIEYLTAILTFITAIYAYLTHRMAKSSEASVEAMRDQSEAMLRPYVTAAPFIRPNTPILYLRVKNTGRTGAQNLRLTLDRDFFQFGEKTGKNLRTMSAFSIPIDSFPPGAELIIRDCSLEISPGLVESHGLSRIRPQTLEPESSFTRHG